ncbi:hypothetical protein [Halosimplex pelagicum]|uniref:Uncharacterized protein n=1 Tax=Halosimplex pelagicum TaxID=869886 RepID=A0A7D5PF05_9EURY|nr:hypothetical protein [Halosimplex pelagicum]QLH82199.1 hypothetical protein HZS54_11535 [Halosimplex pelagicum]
MSLSGTRERGEGFHLLVDSDVAVGTLELMEHIVVDDIPRDADSGVGDQCRLFITVRKTT